MVMTIELREYQAPDVEQVIGIWNDVVKDGIAFPQTECLNPIDGAAFFMGQSYTGVAFDAETQEIVGLYILHPNNIGRCGHICNASYAVKKEIRGQHIGEKLVVHCKQKAAELGFGILQFNAVVKTNYGALHLYKKLGFVPLGTIPRGFRMDDGSYEDIVPHYCVL